MKNVHSHKRTAVGVVAAVDTVSHIVKESGHFCKLHFTLSISKFFQYFSCCLSNLDGMPAGVLREAQDTQAVIALFHVCFHFFGFLQFLINIFIHISFLLPF